MKLFIKNMLGMPSKAKVIALLENLGLHPTIVNPAEVEIGETLPSQKRDLLNEILRKEDFELIAGTENILVEKIRCLVIEMIHYSDEAPEMNYSDYISTRLRLNYTYLSRCFSRIKRITIEHFIIAHKIEKVKQLLVQNEMTLAQIAGKLHYSSTAHLSAQFKKVTGVTPSLFKKTKEKKLIPITEL